MTRLGGRVTSVLGIVSLTGALLLALFGDRPAAGHYKVTGRNVFYFDGTTYGRTKTNGQYHYKSSDPINITMLEWAPTGDVADRGNVENAFSAFWTGPGNMNSDTACVDLASDQYMFFYAYQRYNGVSATRRPVADFNLINKSFFPDQCKNEYHIRWWLDQYHSELTNRTGSHDRHGADNQWVVGGAHYESRGTFGKHHIKRDWYLVRNQVIHYMRGLCSHPHFLKDKQADGMFQGHESDGWIGAITLQRIYPGFGGCG